MGFQYSDDLVQDVDLIILGGYYGTGKYTGAIKSFMMGVAAPTSAQGENPSRFLAVVAVSTGIGDRMLSQLQTKLAPHWTKKRPESIAGPKVNTVNVTCCLGLLNTLLDLLRALFTHASSGESAGCMDQSETFIDFNDTCD